MGEVRYEGVGRGGTADFVWRPGGRGAEWGTWGDVVKQGALSPALSRGGSVAFAGLRDRPREVLQRGTYIL